MVKHHQFATQTGKLVAALRIVDNVVAENSASKPESTFIDKAKQNAYAFCASIKCSFKTE